jgi:hypothetical protein
MEDPAKLLSQWMEVDESVFAFARADVPSTSPVLEDDQGILTIASPGHLAGLLRDAQDPANLLSQWMEVDDDVFAFPRADVPSTSPVLEDDQGILTIASPEHLAGLLRDAQDSNVILEDVVPNTGDRNLLPSGPTVRAEKPYETKRRYDNLWFCCC